MKKIKCILWDWNGTLLNDVDLCVFALNAMLKRYQLPEIQRTDYTREFTFPVRDFYENLGFDFAEYAFETISAEWIDIYKDNLTKRSELNLDILHTLELLKQKKLEQHILSACEIELLTTSAKHFDIVHYFDKIYGADNIHGAGKIHIGEKWLQENVRNPQETMLLGDTIHDAEVAKRMGIKCVLIARGHQDKNRLQTANVPVVNTIKDFLKMFES